MKSDEELHENGVVLLRDAVPCEDLLPLAQSAAAMAAAQRFKPFSYSLCLSALPEFAELKIVARPWSGHFCRLEHSWLRLRYAPANAPPHYHPNSWHQDGGLGVTFDDHSVPTMNRHLTLWLPLQACGTESPGLEFVRHPLDQLLHFTELEDTQLRTRFKPELFWAPVLNLGDALLLLPGTLHRTYETPQMTHDRLSLEYRFFPTD